ncbi:DUF305 domain-containing protein [Streptomyces sp. NBC_00158]|uniref:DUF305 domain-containing protein n=1 Tax=Streptomyces sp. NBC_00158 TaxID=2903627 RepID=UPI003249C840
MNTNRSLPRRAALAATAVAAGLVLAACGSDNTTDTAGTAPATATAPAPSEADRHNQADVAFAQGKTRGNAFDTMFLTMMIGHHEGAVAMAKAEKQQGAHGPAKALADDIITSQTAEIAQMRGMLKAG